VTNSRVAGPVYWPGEARRVGGGDKPLLPRRAGLFAERVQMRYIGFEVRGVDPFANVNLPGEAAWARLQAQAHPRQDGYGRPDGN
jgi:hypothetical protein